MNRNYADLTPILIADDNTVEVTVPHAFQEVPRLPINPDGLLLQRTDLRNKVQPTLALFLLQLEGDVAHGALGDAFHEVGGEPGDLVSHALGRGDGDLVDETLVGVEVEREPRVVLLDDGPRGLLHGLGADSLWAGAARNDERQGVLSQAVKRESETYKRTRPAAGNPCA